MQNNNLLDAYINNNNLFIKYKNDISFATDGILMINLNDAEYNASDDKCYDMIFDKNDNIYIASSFKSININSLEIIKLNKFGIIDNSFATNGILTINKHTDTIFINIDMQENIYVLYNVLYKDKSQTILEKYTKYGLIDIAFNNQKEYIVDFNLLNKHTEFTPYVLYIDKYDNIYIGGSLEESAGLVKLNKNGNVDNDFGIDGYLCIELNGVHNKITSIKIDDMNNIICCNSVINNNNITNGVLIKLNKFGDIINSFGINGIINIYINNAFTVFYDLFIDNNNIIVVGCNMINTSTSTTTTTVIAKYNNDGILDNTFGINGYTHIIYPDSKSNYSYSIDMDMDKNFIIIGKSIKNNDILECFCSKFDMNGKIIDTFGVNGILTFDLSNYILSKVKVNSNNKYICCGYIKNMDENMNENDDILVLCFNSNGILHDTNIIYTKYSLDNGNTFNNINKFNLEIHDNYQILKISNILNNNKDLDIILKTDDNIFSNVIQIKIESKMNYILDILNKFNIIEDKYKSLEHKYQEVTNINTENNQKILDLQNEIAELKNQQLQKVTKIINNDLSSGSIAAMGNIFMKKK
jgi:uncharacterized delta-60 repeat protein